MGRLFLWCIVSGMQIDKRAVGYSFIEGLFDNPVCFDLKLSYRSNLEIDHNISSSISRAAAISKEFQMKKLLTLATISLITIALASSSSYSSAQCIGCSQGVAPVFAQPMGTVGSLGTAQSYGAPVYNSGVYDAAPVYGAAPSYSSAPIYDSTPVYSSAPFVSSVPSANSYVEPVYGSPVISSAVETPISLYSQPLPVYSQPTVSYPVPLPVAGYPSSVGSCCGGIVGGGVVAQPIQEGYPAFLPGTYGGFPVPSGAIIDGSTVIGETVIASTPTVVGEAGGDSVSPPEPVADDNQGAAGSEKSDGAEEAKVDDGT